MFENKTKNQHYLSQCEQRFNAIDGAVKKGNCRIYQFEIKNKKTQEFDVVDNNGIKIEKNLAFDDLYTFFIKEDGIRGNFEAFFKNYEDKIFKATTKLLNVSDLSKEEFIDLIAAKFMNLLRNPWSISFIIENFGFVLENDKKLNNDQKIEYNKIDKLGVPQNILGEFLVNEGDYKKWLKIIFCFVVTSGDGKKSSTYLDNFIRSLLGGNDKKYIYTYLFIYHNEICLLSDKGLIAYSNTEGEDLSISMNLSKNAFLLIELRKNKHVYESDSNFSDLNSGEIVLNQGFKVHDIQLIKDRPEQEWFKYWIKYNSMVISESCKTFYAADQNFKFK